MKLMVFNNPPTPDWTMLLVVIYYDIRILTIFSWYTDVGLPAQFWSGQKFHSYCSMLCKGHSFVGFPQTKSGLPHVDNNGNGMAREPKLRVTEI